MCPSRCAVVGSSASLLSRRHGAYIDGHDDLVKRAPSDTARVATCELGVTVVAPPRRLSGRLGTPMSAARHPHGKKVAPLHAIMRGHTSRAARASSTQPRVLRLAACTAADSTPLPSAT